MVNGEGVDFSIKFLPALVAKLSPSSFSVLTKLSRTPPGALDLENVPKPWLRQPLIENEEVKWRDRKAYSHTVRSCYHLAYLNKSVASMPKPARIWLSERHTLIPSPS